MPIKKIIISLFFAFSLSGCSFLYDTFVYQIDITQGNYIEDKKIQEVKIGMTQEQVIFILGSPMLIDQFDSSKWYYLRYIKPGGEDIQQTQMLLVFQDKILIQMVGDFAIAESTLDEDHAEPNASASGIEEEPASQVDSVIISVGG